LLILYQKLIDTPFQVRDSLLQPLGLSDRCCPHGIALDFQEPLGASEFACDVGQCGRTYLRPA
jgi:hypothetical protein